MVSLRHVGVLHAAGRISGNVEVDNEGKLLVSGELNVGQGAVVVNSASGRVVCQGRNTSIQTFGDVPGRFLNYGVITIRDTAGVNGSFRDVVTPSMLDDARVLDIGVDLTAYEGSLVEVVGADVLTLRGTAALRGNVWVSAGARLVVRGDTLLSGKCSLQGNGRVVVELGTLTTYEPAGLRGIQVRVLQRLGVCVLLLPWMLHTETPWMLLCCW
jgi:hypothetical protein